MGAFPGGCAGRGMEFLPAAPPRARCRRAIVEIYSIFSFPRQVNTRERGKQLCVRTDVVQKWYRTSTYWTKTGRDLYETCTCWDGGGKARAIEDEEAGWACRARTTPQYIKHRGELGRSPSNRSRAAGPVRRMNRSRSAGAIYKQRPYHERATLRALPQPSSTA